MNLSFGIDLGTAEVIALALCIVMCFWIVAKGQIEIAT